MKKFGKILTLVIATMAVAVCAVMFTACGSNVKTYTASYTLESKADMPASPLAASNHMSASAYVGAFGKFADSVGCNATLVVDGENYTFTWKVLCGTEESGGTSYQPEYVWTGKVLEATDTSVKLGAAETAKVTIYSYNQTSVNAETIGRFGMPGYVATHETTDCPYPNVPSGEKLLKLFSAGTYAISGDTLGNYTIG